MMAIRVFFNAVCLLVIVFSENECFKKKSNPDTCNDNGL